MKIKFIFSAIFCIASLAQVQSQEITPFASLGLPVNFPELTRKTIPRLADYHERENYFLQPNLGLLVQSGLQVKYYQIFFRYEMGSSQMDKKAYQAQAGSLPVRGGGFSWYTLDLSMGLVPPPMGKFSFRLLLSGGVHMMRFSDLIADHIGPPNSVFVKYAHRNMGLLARFGAGLLYHFNPHTAFELGYNFTTGKAGSIDYERWFEEPNYKTQDYPLNSTYSWRNHQVAASFIFFLQPVINKSGSLPGKG